MPRLAHRFPLLSAFLLIALARASVAQIDLVPGGRLDVTDAPEFVALGNLDGGTSFEALVLVPGSDNLSAFRASDAGVLTRFLSITLGRRLSGVAARDFDGDGLHDVLVADATGGAQNGDLLLLRGRGDGTLMPPEAFPLPVSALRSFATGDFDGINGPDAVIATGTRDDIAVLLNDGSATAFTALPLFEIERDPRLVRAARLDATGRDSIVLLNTDTSANDELVVLRIDDGVLGLTQPPIRILGTAPVDFVTGDFNRDGATDIAVLHDEIDRIFFVTTLLNQTVATPEGSQPTGMFTRLPALTFDCPTDSGGGLTRCIPESLAAGDFDRDGFTDLAVAFSRPGEVIFLDGIGAGEFGFAGRFQSDASDEPLSLLAGDMTGNRAADLFIGDTGNDSVILLRSNVPAPADDGEDCSRGNQCASQVCLDGVCCRFLTCPSGQRCDIPGREGLCAPLALLGSPCDEGETCASGFCVDDVCCANPGCPQGQSCALPGSAGVCTTAPPTATPPPTATRTAFPTASPTPQPNGRPCSSPVECQSTLCIDGTCCGEVCGANLFCNITDSLGSCAARKFVGQPCGLDSDCVTSRCSGGLCVTAPTATPTTSPSPTPTRVANGFACNAGEPEACASGFCTDGVCCSEAACALGERCDIFGVAGDCRTQLPPGAPCAADSDCRGGAPCVFDDLAGGLICRRTTPTPGPARCFGDCDGNGAVTVDELLVMIEIALGTQPLDNCTAGDIGGDGEISVDELLTAVGLALTGCPAIPPTSPTAAVTVSPTSAPPTSTPAATPSPTIALPTMTPSASATAIPSATPLLPTPTASATSAPTPPLLDLSDFDEFIFEHGIDAGSCPPLGGVVAARLTRAGTVTVVEIDVLRAGVAGEDDCQTQLVGAGECPVIDAVSPVPTILTAAEETRVRDAFAGIELRQQPDETCGVAPSCGAATYDWDAIGASDDPCGDTNRLPAAHATSIRAVLEELRAAREPNA